MLSQLGQEIINHKFLFNFIDITISKYEYNKQNISQGEFL